MSLIKCPECSKEVSDQAKSCPHCGYVFSKNKTHSKIAVKLIAGICAVIAILVLISGINDFTKAKKKDLTATSKGNSFQWSMSDLALYDRQGNEVLYLSEKTNKIKLSDSEGLSTFQGTSIGDNARTALDHYNFEDFIFEFTPAHYLDKEKSQKSSDETSALMEKFSDKTPSEMLDCLDQVSLTDGNFYFSVKLYEFNKKLYTESNLPDKADNSDHDYVLFFYVKDSKIEDVVVQLWKF